MWLTCRKGDYYLQLRAFAYERCERKRCVIMFQMTAQQTIHTYSYVTRETPINNKPNSSCLDLNRLETKIGESHPEWFYSSLIKLYFVRIIVLHLLNGYNYLSLIQHVCYASYDYPKYALSRLHTVDICGTIVNFSTPYAWRLPQFVAINNRCVISAQKIAEESLFNDMCTCTELDWILL